MNTSQTTSNSETSNIIELRVISRDDMDLDDISYFLHNGWVNFKTNRYPKHYVFVRRNAPIEEFQTYQKAVDHDYED